MMNPVMAQARMLAPLPNRSTSPSTTIDRATPNSRSAAANGATASPYDRTLNENSSPASVVMIVQPTATRARPHSMAPVTYSPGVTGEARRFTTLRDHVSSMYARAMPFSDRNRMSHRRNPPSRNPTPVGTSAPVRRKYEVRNPHSSRSMAGQNSQSMSRGNDRDVTYR